MGHIAPKKKGGSLAVGTYLQRGSTLPLPSTPPPPHRPLTAPPPPPSPLLTRALGSRAPPCGSGGAECAVRGSEGRLLPVLGLEQCREFPNSPGRNYRTTCSTGLLLYVCWHRAPRGALDGGLHVECRFYEIRDCSE